MAYISQRGAYWRAEVRRKGYKPTYRTFDTRQQAQKWARSIEAEMDVGSYIDRSQAERTTLSEALNRYLQEVVPTKRHPYQESRRISRWLDNDLAYRSLASLRGVDFARYRDLRREAGRAENTIRLELQLISHLYETARKEWGMESLGNPLQNIRKPSGSRARSRRLESGEYDRIHARLDASTNRYAAPVFDLAIETSLRQGVLFQLRWEWVDLGKRMIMFPGNMLTVENKSVPPILPLSIKATAVLKEMPAQTLESQNADSTGLVLKTTANAVVCLWKRTLADLGIEDLRWHDLRHEAASRLFEKGLHPMEVTSITGHRSMQMLKRYTHLKPESLLEKLG
ncbi:site-specific integrase [Pusillimonas sp. NJUB218]|uniref:site-specific integrase n=1 Tax=Pusillimonas sp. NJUB218 TaxID=2023230 RepID=UPI000F4BB8D4|nr:site-specific integrase [Pusillimonas sp. NJUB218]ROT44710.1 integrase [Pusillimonas sp. NJUB218]